MLRSTCFVGTPTVGILRQAAVARFFAFSISGHYLMSAQRIVRKHVEAANLRLHGSQASRGLPPKGSYEPRRTSAASMEMRHAWQLRRTSRPFASTTESRPSSAEPVTPHCTMAVAGRDLKERREARAKYRRVGWERPWLELTAFSWTSTFFCSVAC